MTDQASLLQVLGDFARRLAHDSTTTDALHDLVDALTAALGVAGAGVSLVHQDTVTFVTAANQAVDIVERLQERTQSGPCVEAHHSSTPVLVADLTEEPHRWPTLTDVAVKAGLVAVACISMRLEQDVIGTVNLYDNVRHDWSSDEIRVATVLADMATASLAHAIRLDQARETAEQLQQALQSRILIEQAKGMLAGEKGISVDDAFRLLRAHARSHHASLHSVSHAVVNLGLRL